MGDLHRKAFCIPSCHDDILKDERTVSVISKALNEALSVMMMGCVDQANRILDCLYAWNNFEWGEAETRVYMHLAWAASGCWPRAITRPEDGKLSAAAPSMIQIHGGEDGPALVPELVESARKLCDERIHRDPYAAEWTFDDFREIREEAKIEGNLVFRREAWPHVVSVEAAFDLGLDEVAVEIARDRLVRDLVYEGMWKTPWSMGILYSQQLWKLLCQGWLRKELGLTVRDVGAHVDVVLELLEQRFTNRVKKSYLDTSIADILRFFDADYLAWIRFRDEDDAPQIHHAYENNRQRSPYLADPASEQQIKQLDTKARGFGYTHGLPNDYRNFLKTSDGLHEDDTDGADILYSVAALEFRDPGLKVALLPYDFLGRALVHRHELEQEIEWPPMGNTLRIGVGMFGRGYWLVKPSSLEQALDVLDQALLKANPADRRRLERAVTDLYGSVEDMRKMDGLIMANYSNDDDMDCFVGLKELLISLVDCHQREPVDLSDIEYRSDDSSPNST